MLASGRRTALYQRCMAPVLAARRQELFERVMAIRGVDLTQRPVYASPVAEETVRMSFDDLRAKMISKRVYSYDLWCHRSTLMRAIRKMVSVYHGLNEDALSSDTRRVDYVRARQLCFFLIYMHESRSLPYIGKAFGGRDHTTVLHGIRRSQEKFHKADPKFRAAYDYARGNLYDRDYYYWAA